MIKEFHLFAGIGGGIYGGKMLGHQCCGGVEIDPYCQKVLAQRQFSVLCGGFPCQAFSYAAHGKNIEEKNLWPDMFKFVKDSDAPVVFGENVTIEAIMTARKDLESIGYKVESCRLACMDLSADHKRPRFWLLAVKDASILQEAA